VVEGLGCCSRVPNVVGAVVSWRILSRPLGGLAGRRSRKAWADAPGRRAGLLRWAVTFMVGWLSRAGHGLRGHNVFMWWEQVACDLYLLFPGAGNQRGIRAMTSP